MADEPDRIMYSTIHENNTDDNVHQGLTYQDIELLPDLSDAIALAETHNVDYDGLESLSEFKCRLKCHLTLTKSGNLKDKIQRQIADVGKDDKIKRENLCRMVNELKNVFPKKSLTQTIRRQEIVEELLNKDGSTDDIREDCDKRIASLQEKECVILIAGESSAGKSSLLNAILGEEILPSHMLPCTSCITVIKYYAYRNAIIVYRDGHIDKIPNLDKEGLQQLQQRAYFSKANQNKPHADVYAARKEEHDIAEIQVYLPLPMLANGLVLVDTPGIGENEFLENYLMEYIRTHQILGFMYIIMTDNALGIAEDRLVNLMSLIIKSQKSSTDIVKFNPKAALFVCNRWDMVKDEDKDAVRRNAINQLEKTWPEFEPKLAVFFSTMAALREQNVNPGYVTDEFVALLLGLQSLVNVSLDKRIHASYRWMGNVLQRSVHYLRTMVRTLEMSGRERQRKSAEATQKLNVLDRKAGDVVKHLKSEMEYSVRHISDEIKKYLQTTQAARKLSHKYGTKDGELPNMQHASGTWEWVKRHIETAFDNRLNDLLDEWDRETQQISDVEKKLFRQAKLHLSDLESEMTEIEKECHTENLPAALRDSGVFLNNLCRSIEDFEEDLLFDHKVPHKLLSQLSKKITRQIRKKREDLKLKEYENSPSKVAQKQAEKLLDKMLKDKDPRLESFVREFLQRPFNYISRLESKIPSLIDSNKELQGRFEKEVVDEGKERQHYVEMMTRIEKLRTDLVRYGELSVFCNDFENEDIEIVQHFHESKGRNMKRKQSMADLMQANQLSDDTCSTIVPHGQWHIVHIGRIRRGSETEYVVVKLYKVKIDNMQTELAKLRCLLHNDVCLAEFLGVHHQPDFMTPALIFSGKLQSAHNYTRTHPDVNKPKLLEEVLTGLQYIHSKGLVHMELSKYSLTVNASGNVQMTGQCLPRTMTADPYNNVSSNVYLAPEVLRGSIYVAHADMYAFAILALEIMDPKKSDDDRIVTLTRQGSKALQAEIMQLELDSRVNEKLTACLNAMEERPSAQIVAATLKFKDRKLSTLAPRNIFARLTLKK